MRIAVLLLCALAPCSAEQLFRLNCSSTEPRLVIARSIFDMSEVRCNSEFVLLEFSTMDELRSKISSLLKSGKMMRIDEVGYFTAEYPEVCSTLTTFAYIAKTKQGTPGLYACRSIEGRATVFPMHSGKLNRTFRLVSLKE